LNTEMELLKSEIQQGRDETPARQSTIVALNIAWSPYNDQFMNKVNIVHGYRIDAGRAARLLFLSEVVGRSLNSSKELSQGEAVRILRWLSGEHPSPQVRVSDSEREGRRSQRLLEVTWFLTLPENKLKAGAMARTFRVERTSANGK